MPSSRSGSKTPPVWCNAWFGEGSRGNGALETAKNRGGGCTGCFCFARATRRGTSHPASHAPDGISISATASSAFKSMEISSVAPSEVGGGAHLADEHRPPLSTPTRRAYDPHHRTLALPPLPKAAAGQRKAAAGRWSCRLLVLAWLRRAQSTPPLESADMFYLRV
jgi:hypothetical protein